MDDQVVVVGALPGEREPDAQHVRDGGPRGVDVEQRHRRPGHPRGQPCHAAPEDARADDGDPVTEQRRLRPTAR